MIIYQLTNRLNGKSYVGQTIQPFDVRLSAHLRDKTSKLPLHRALRKYGVANFECRILLYADNLKELNFYEQAIIARFNTLSPKGYNCRSGGENSLHIESTKRKISQMKMGQLAWNRGIPMNAASRAKLSAALKGREVWNTGKETGPRSEETKKKIGISTRTRFNAGEQYGFKNPEVFAKGLATRRANPTSAWNKGLKMPSHSDEQKQKISDGLKRAYAEGRREPIGEMMKRGTDVLSAKLTEVDIRFIRSNIGRLTGAAMARMLNVNKTTVCRVITGQTWAHIE